MPKHNTKQEIEHERDSYLRALLDIIERYEQSDRRFETYEFTASTMYDIALDAVRSK